MLLAGEYSHRKEWIRDRKEVLRFLIKLPSNLPITLDYICFKTQVQIERLLIVLDELIKSMKIGQYSEDEQAFIRSNEELKRLEQAFQLWAQNEKKE